MSTNFNNPMMNAAAQAAAGSYHVGSEKQANKADKDKRREDTKFDEIKNKFIQQVQKPSDPSKLA